MNIIEEFLTIQQNVRVYHWTTNNYNQHIVTGELYEKLDKLFDKFIETYLGERKIKYSPITIQVKDNDIMHMLKRFKQFLMSDFDLVLTVDLKNIRDDILGEINRFIFLLRLK